MASDVSTDSVPNAKQVVFLFMAATVVAVVVFLCGVLVGRGVPLGGGLTVAGSARSPSSGDLPPATLSSPSSEPSAAAGESGDLTYYRLLNGGESEPETLGSSTDDSGVDATSVDGIADAPAPRDAEAAAVAGAERPASDVATAPEATRDPALVSPPPSATSGPAAQSAPTREGFAVQVVAVRSAASAQRVAAQLSSKGYPAVVVQPAPDAPALFRVQVGPYADRAAAQRILRRLEAEEALTPFITR